MAKIPIYATGSWLFNGAAPTNYQALTDSTLGAGTSTLTQGSVTYHTAGTLSNFWARLSTNGSTVGGTFKIYVNGVAGNEILSIPATTTGTFTDAIHTDAVTAGQTVNGYFNNGDATNGLTVTVASVLFSATTNTAKRIGPANQSITLSSASVTDFFPLSGTLAAATESKIQTTLYANGTLQNLSVYVGTNGRSVASTARTRINTANGNLSASITGSTTGEFSDTSDTDTLVNTGTVVDCSLSTGSGSGSLTTWAISADVITTDGSTVVTGSSASTTQNANLTKYYLIAGDCVASGTEANQESVLGASFTISEVNVTVNTNTVTAASTFKLRKNTANGNSSASITASTTGTFVDTTDSDSLISTDTVDYALTTGATGTSLNLTAFSALLTQPIVASGNSNQLMMMGCGS